MSRKIFVIVAIALSPLLLLVLASLFYSNLRKDHFIEKEVVEIKTEQARRAKGSLLTVAATDPQAKSSPAGMRNRPTSSPVTSPSPEPTVSVEDLVRMVEEDDVCGLWLKGGIASLELPKLVSLLSQLRSFSSLDRATQSYLESHATSDPLQVEERLRAGGTDTTDFYDALLSAGLLSGGGLPKQPIDLSRARDSLESLARRYSDNAAIAYYWLVVEKYLDAPPERLDAVIEQMSRATSFDSFENLFARDILEANLGSAAGMLVARQVNSSIRIPDATEVSAILRERLEENPALAPGLIELGKTILDQEERRAEGLEFVDWSYLRMTIGKIIAKMGWRYTEGNENFPAEIDRDLKKIRQMSTLGSGTLDALNRLHQEEGCDRGGIDEEYRLLTNRRRFR